MVEYCYDAETLETLEVREGDDIIGMEEDPILGDIYDFGFDGVYVYLEERDDAKAKQIIIDNYVDKLNKAKQLKVVEM